MSFSLYIAKRYLFSKSSNNAINIITIIATLGVIVGTLALVLVLSVFSGLKTFTASFLNTTAPEIKITSSLGKSFVFSKNLEKTLNNNQIDSYSKVIEERAFFNYKNKDHIAYIKGVDTSYTKVTPIDSIVYSGKWLNFKTNTAVIGNGVSNKLSLSILNYGEPLHIYVPKPGKGYITNVKKAFTTVNTQVCGVFSISEELDNKYVYIPLKLSQQLLSYPKNKITAIEIKCSPELIAKNVEALKNQLGDSFKVQSQEELNAAFYKILNSEKLFGYLIGILISSIALFNVIGSIIMMILDKKDNLKTLSNLGATLQQIKQIFVYQGFLVALFGLFVGVFLAVTVIVLQNQFHLLMITRTIPYPIELKFSNIALVCITIGTLGFIAAKIASSRISKKLIE